jgi:hypothetical protein
LLVAKGFSLGIKLGAGAGSSDFLLDDNGDSIVDSKDDCPSLGLADGSKNSEEPWRSTEARPNPKTEQDQRLGTGPSRTEARPKVSCGAPRQRREAGEEHRGQTKSEDRAGPALRNRAKSEDQAGTPSRNGTKQNRGEAEGFVRSTEAKARSLGGAPRPGQIRGPPRKGPRRSTADDWSQPPEVWSRPRSGAEE